MAAPQLTAYVQGQGTVSGDQLNTFEQTCDTFAQMRTVTGTLGMQIAARGASSVADGGGGVFWWSASATAADDNSTTIAPHGSAIGRWIRVNFPVAIIGATPNIVVTPSSNPQPVFASLAVTGTTGHPGSDEFLGVFNLDANSLGNKVALYAGVTAHAGCQFAWSINSVLLIPPGGGTAPGFVGQGYELDVQNNSGINFGDGAVFTPPAVLGISVSGGGSRVSAAYELNAANPVFNLGIAFLGNSVADIGILDTTNSPTVFQILGSHTAGIDTTLGTFQVAPLRIGNGQSINWQNGTHNGDLETLVVTSNNVLTVGSASMPFIQVANSVNPASDNTFTLGTSSARYASVWAATGVVNSSAPGLKTDVADLPSMLGVIAGVSPKSYKFISGGFERQEVQEVQTVPETKDVPIELKETVLVDGVARQKTRTVTRQVPVYDDMPVLNADGSPATHTTPAKPEMRDPATGRLIRAARPERTEALIHRQPRTTTKSVSVTKFVERPGQRTHFGFMAPDFKAAFDKVGMDFGGYVKDAESGDEGLRSDQIQAVLWRGVQELIAQNEALTARIAALEAQEPGQH